MKNLIFFAVILLLGSCTSKPIPENANAIDLPTELSEIGLLLDSIHTEDQKYRTEIEGIMNEFGWESEEMKNLWSLITEVDSSNLQVVEQILATHGWLSSEQIGNTANSTLFFVIQHSNQKTQEKYLPMIRQAVKEGKAESKRLALLEDRIGINNGELQVYGSQIGTYQETGKMYVRPLVDPDNVNERRAKVGLGTIEDYISYWNMEWDVEDYKKQLPKLIEIQKAELSIMVK